jgi:hypothetical protein
MSIKYIKVVSVVIIMLITMSSLCNKNKLPNTPTVPSGPTSGFVDSTYTFSSSATDPEADNVSIRFYWGGTDTSDWSGYVTSGSAVTASYAWSFPGTYSVKAQAMDEDSVVSAWSTGHTIDIISRFTKTYGGPNNEYGYAVAQTTDGGYIITGPTSSFGTNTDVWLIKTNANGDTTWTKTFGGSSYDYSNSVQQTTDGGYIIAGYSNSYGTSTDLYLIKTDANGNQSWYRTFGGSSTDYGYLVEQTSDGGYIIAGYSNSYGTSYDVYLVKTDASGNQLWYRTFGGSGTDYGYSVAQTSDGGYVITGYTTSYGTGGNVYLIKTDTSGNQSWYKSFGGTNSDYGYSVAQTSDGGYVIAGYTASYGTGGDVYLIKTDTSGNQTWSKNFGGSNYDESYSVQQTSDGGYIIAGYMAQSISDDDAYLIKTFANGNTEWTKTFGGAQIEHGHAVVQTSDGGYAIAGHTSTYGAGNADFWLIKTDEDGNAK